MVKGKLSSAVGAIARRTKAPRSIKAATVRQQHASASGYRAAQQSQKDFILSILESHPSARDSRLYLQNFGPVQRGSDLPHNARLQLPKVAPRAPVASTSAPTPAERLTTAAAKRTELVESILNPVRQHTALVKIQGPFTDRQLASVAEGMIYLRKLGLVSIIVLDSEEWTPDLPQDELRAAMTEETMRFAELLEQRDTRARPILEAILREAVEGEVEADSLLGLRAAIAHGDIPILPPFALDASLQSRCVSADKAVIALARALAHAGHREWVVTSPNPDPPIVAEAAAGPAAEAIMAETSVVEDLTPLRMMIINREGGVPSPARGGNPHLSINLESEYKFIEDTFVWQDSHPTALRNLALTRACLAELPRESSALIVSHRSPKSLVANLITNKPAFSPSLHHSLLPSATTIQHTPTIVRRGLPIRVLKTMSAADEVALTTLLEASFGKTLDRDPYFAHLRRHLDFVIVAGDWAAAAVVTAEGEGGDVCYLDKFAVLPTLQGDGTVDFLWGALRDETSGLGLLDALNNNGGAEGVGRGRDLVWRSRADNPVNRWYFERSSGFVRIQPTAVTDTGARMGAAHLFWCDAEERVEALAKRVEGAGVVADEEKGRLKRWAEVVGAIPSCWKA